MLKRFLGFVVGGTFLLAFIYLSYMNGQEVAFRYYPGRDPIAGPLMILLLAAFFLGALLIFLLALLRETQWTVRDLRRRRLEKKAEVERSRVEAGRQLQWGGQADQARNVLRRARRRADGPDAYRILAQADLESGRLDEARATLEDGLANHRDDPQLLALFADVYRRLGQPTVATVQLEKAVAADPKSPRLLETLRDAYMGESRWVEALRTEEALLGTLRSPDRILREQPLIRGLRYEAALAAEGDAARIQDLRSVLAQYPGFVPAAVALGDVFRRTDRVPEALRVWTRAAQQRPLPVLLERIEDTWTAAGQSKKVMSFYRSLTREHPRSIWPALGVVRMLLAEEKDAEADEEIERLRARFDHDAGLHRIRAERHRRQGEWRAAAEALSTALARLESIAWRCRECARPAVAWRPRCEGCGHWDSLETSTPPARETVAELAPPAA